MIGPIENIRFIFLILLKTELLAIADPAAEAMSHEPRKVPAISS